MRNINDGSLISSIPVPNYPEAKGMPFFASFVSSVKYTTSPDGKNICCCMAAASALSFSKVEGNKLIEQKRFEYDNPSVKNSGKFLVYDQDQATTRFISITSNNDNVFVLYSGKKLSGTTPAYEGNHVVKYDWNGNVISHYILDKSLNYINLADTGNYLIGTTTEPNPTIFCFNIN